MHPHLVSYITLFHAVPTFEFEPDAIEVRPESSGRSVAAFACSIINHDSLEVQFQWVFTPVNSTVRTTLTNADRSVTILGVPALVDPRTSILILDSVSAKHEGSYFCVVKYCCGNITSKGAKLIYNGKSWPSWLRMQWNLGMKAKIKCTSFLRGYHVPEIINKLLDSLRGGHSTAIHQEPGLYIVRIQKHVFSFQVNSY